MLFYGCFINDFVSFIFFHISTFAFVFFCRFMLQFMLTIFLKFYRTVEWLIVVTACVIFNCNITLMVVNLRICTMYKYFR